ncbi:MAG TPA: hypothetical protein VK041_00695 [Opitutales bacterium]|nr:hypothetical protein [Opitutales bacterium]
MYELSDPVSRRKALAMIGTGGVLFATSASRAVAQPNVPAASGPVKQFSTAQELKTSAPPADGEFAQTAGYFTPGDGGGAIYRIERRSNETEPNDGDILGLRNNRVALLQESESVNYTMFGAIGDGENDDGVQIRRAHAYASRENIPVVNLSGEFWIKESYNIAITTNVHWGKTIFHIDERFNRKDAPRFSVRGDHPRQNIEFSAEEKAEFLKKLKPGVKIIPELAPYAGCLISISDNNDRIGIRAGANYSKRGWAREELFYVEVEGRIIGDIAWEFTDYTSLTATPCNDNYLTIEGGGFYFSGDVPGDKYDGYYHHGISITRSRTIIRNQWMGLEKGKSDISMQARRGFYVFSRVYDVTLENIRAIPWEQNRADKSRVVAAGTYGIGGARMLKCTFRNLIAEGGNVAWGVFGTNLNKDFRLENCRLNRVDVHFHCWNLHIVDCSIGFRGISVTGGGNLLIENTERHGNHFLNLRRDYGAKWDGDIRLNGCKLKPTSNGVVSIIYQRPANFDYQYPIGVARSIQITDLTVDYSAAPNSTATCWLINTVNFSKTNNGDRLFYPDFAEFRNIRVVGREKGIRLFELPAPGDFEINRKGSYDGVQLRANSRLIFDNIQLEELHPENPDDASNAHLRLGGASKIEYADEHALYPQIEFKNCENLNVYLGHVIASATFENCSINTIFAPELRGELAFRDCRIQPKIKNSGESLWSVDSELGTRFTNCTLHIPEIDGNASPDEIDKLSFVEINKTVKHYHLNTALGNDLLNHLREADTELAPEFIEKLKAHHALEK